MSEGKRLTLQISNTISELTTVIDTTVKLAAEVGLSKSQIHNIMLILDELISNIINYAYQDEQTHTIDIEISWINQSPACRGRLCDRRS